MSDLAVRPFAISNMDDLARVSKMLAESGYFRDARDAAQVGVKVLCGLESGFGAFAAMSGVHIIEGKPSIGANLMALAIKRSGRYNYRIIEHTDEACSVSVFERWDGQWQEVGVSRFTLDDAKRAGVRLKDSKGNPTPWGKYPRNMLFARAISNAVRWYCPDALSVTAYVPEELGANVDAEGNVIDVEAIAAPQKPSEPAGDPAPTNSPVPAEAPNTGTQALGEARAQAMAFELRRLGFNERQITHIADFAAGRKVQALADLTEDEARKVYAEAKRQAKRLAEEGAIPARPEVKDFDPHARPEPVPARLNNEHAQKLHRALGAFGVKDHNVFAEVVIGRTVESFTELTIPESIRVYEYALEQHGSDEQKAAYAARKAA